MPVTPEIPGVTSLALVGQGSVATVYSAEHTRTRTRVAVKVLTFPFSTEVERRRFEHDATIVMGLAGKPGIGRIVDVGVSKQGIGHLVLEWAPTSLAANGTVRTLEWGEAVALVARLGEGLAEAHRAGTVHLGIRPENVALVNGQDARLVDFGLSLLLPAGAPRSTTVLRHLAPEQVQGRTGDALSDLYSLASVLHQLVAGNPPIVLAGDSADVAASKIVSTLPPSLQRFGVPPQLDKHIQRALAKDPSQRQDSVATFVAELRSAPPRADSPARAGDAPSPVIPGLEVTGRIGGGGFATVYEAWQERHNRRVAVKVLKGESFDPKRLSQFDAESRIMGQVSNHPSIVTIHDANVTAEGRPYIVMELYDKGHYGRRAAGGSMSQTEVLRVGIKIAAAVETAHRAGIIHRDIKPENILINEFGRPGLTDFGIASATATASADDSGSMTLQFAAPELIDRSGEPSRASDVYSLAATLWAMLTGHAPYHSAEKLNDVEVMRRIITSPVPRMPRPGINARFEQLLRQSLDKDPTKRPKTAAELAHALRQVELDLGGSQTELDLADGSGHAGGSTGGQSDGDGRSTIAGPGAGADLDGATIVANPVGAAPEPPTRPKTAKQPERLLRPAWYVGAAIIVTGAIAAVVVIASGSDDDAATAPTTTALAATTTIDVGDPFRVPELTDLTATRTSGTTIEIAWVAVDALPGDRILIRQTTPVEAAEPNVVTTSPFEATVTAGEGTFCFDVIADGGTQQSEAINICTS